MTDDRHTLSDGRSVCNRLGGYCDKSSALSDEQARLVTNLSSGQVALTLLAGRAAVVLSVLYAVALLGVWLWCAVTARQMPEVPWYIQGVALATFGGGMILHFKPKVQ